jgi:glycosyltransferase involved in cell wall biosynthesis
MQSLRLHAASVGVADRLSVQALEVLIDPGPFDAAAVWVTAAGDTGAVAVLSAMMRRIPVVVPRGSDIEAMVAPRITGIVADETDLPGTAAALAELLADADEHHAVGAAAAARAERLHGWAAMMTKLEQALLRVAGKPSHSRTAA